MNNLKTLAAAISFAAIKHRKQKRKGEEKEPYINHPIELLNLLTNVGNVEDFDVLVAAVLHDTIEDTDATSEEITNFFGAKAAGMVLEVTDDKSLPKQVRKQKQIEHAPHLSDGAKLIKLADKISNIRDVVENPPSDWSDKRRLEYAEWGVKVIDGIRGTNKELEDYFDTIIETARQKFK